MDWVKIILGLAPKALPKVVEAFRTADTDFQNFQVTTPLVQAYYLAECLHETGGFRVLEENLKYSAERLHAVWPTRFPTIESAKPFAWDPSDDDREDVALADFVYGARMGNERNGTNDDDGWNYRGRGPLMITGHDNYAEMGRRSCLSLLDKPDLATSSRYMLPISLHFWNWKGLSALASKDDLRGVTKIINGGTIGLKERAVWLAKTKAVLNA